MSFGFSDGFVCTDYMRRVYPDYEKMVMPVIMYKAASVRLWAPYVDLDDAIQEGRLTLLRCIEAYDISKSNGGGLKRYVGKALDNCYRDMFWRAVAQCRMPHTYVQGGDGEWQRVRAPLMSLDAMLDMDGGAKYEPCESSPDPEAVLTNSYLDEEAKRFKMKMLNMLTGVDKKLFEAKYNPSTELIKMCDNLGHTVGGDSPEVPNVVVAEYLKITKNQVDHRMYKIRKAFTKLVRDVDFSDLFGEIVGTKGWPMIHINDAECHNRDFVRRIMAERSLEAQPCPGWDATPEHYQKAGTYARWVERYPWGAVIVLKNGDQWRTIVAEGERININNGFVFGTNGVTEELGDYVPWYQSLVSHLKEARGGKK